MGTPAAISAQLRNLITQRTLAQAMSRCLLIAEGTIKREAPVKTGFLRRSITSRMEQGGRVGRVGTNAPHARPVNFGSKPHIIRPRRARALMWPGAAHPVRVVHHPGNRPNDFMGRGAAASRAPIERELAAWGGRAFGSVK
jgi:hypothetical protein